MNYVYLIERIALAISLLIVSWAIYSIFELMLRRKERLAIIDKLGDKLKPELLKSPASLMATRTARVENGISFGTLKTALFTLGVGLGFLTGIIVCDNLPIDSQNLIGELVIIASTIIGSGVGLLGAFITEVKMSKHNKDNI